MFKFIIEYTCSNLRYFHLKPWNKRGDLSNNNYLTSMYYVWYRILLQCRWGRMRNCITGSGGRGILNLSGGMLLANFCIRLAPLLICENWLHISNNILASSDWVKKLSSICYKLYIELYFYKTICLYMPNQLHTSPIWKHQMREALLKIPQAIYLTYLLEYFLASEFLWTTSY